MSTVLDNMTIQESAQHFNVSEKTIRRWIKQGKLKAELIDGRWHVQDDGHLDQTIDQTALIEQLQSENAYLREQIDHLTQLLGLAQKNVSMLSEQSRWDRERMVENMRRRSWWKQLFRWLKSKDAF